MPIESEQARRAQSDPHDIVSLVLPSLSLGLFLGSTWAALHFTGFGGLWSLPLTFIALIASGIALAAFAPARLMTDRKLLEIIVGASALHLLCVAGAAAFEGPSEALALGIASSLFEGAALACVGKTCLSLIASKGPRRSCIGVCGALFLSNAWYFIFIAAGSLVIGLQWALGEVASVAALAVATRRLAPVQNQNDEDTARGKAALSPSFAAFLATSAVLMVAQGIFSTAAGFGVDPAFQGMSSSILVVGIRALMLLLCLTGIFSSFSHIRALVAFSLLWIVLLTMNDTALFPAAATWSVSFLALGQYVLMAFVLMAATHEAAGKGRGQASAILSLAFAAIMLNQPTRLIGLVAGSSLTTLGLHVVCDAAMLAVSACAIVCLAWALRRQSLQVRAAQAPESPSLQDGGFENLSAVGRMLWKREQESFGQFIRFCETHGLSEREQEVLFEALHGYTVAAIAQHRDISQETVKTYLKRAYARVGCSNKQDLLAVMDAEQ